MTFLSRLAIHFQIPLYITLQRLMRGNWLKDSGLGTFGIRWMKVWFICLRVLP